MSFSHLHFHTEHSSLDGTIRIKAGPKRAKALGQKAIAITDHGDLTGAYAFHKACLEEGIKPIIGNEFYLAIGSRFEKNTELVPNDDDNSTDADDGKEKSKKYMHLTVLARNEQGWKSLLALHNKAEDSFYYKPRIDFDLIAEHGEGLTILTGCLGGPVAGPLARAGAADKAGDAATAETYRNQARANLDTMIAAVGREHVFLEVMFHGIKAETHAFREIRALSEETGIPMVATNDCHYEHQEDASAHDAFLAVGVKKTLDDPERFSFNGTPDYYIKSEEEMLSVLGNIKNEAAAAAWRQACANTQLVVDQVAERTIPEGRMRLPAFPVPEAEGTAEEYLYKLVKAGARDRGNGRITKEVGERLRVELDIINGMGFPSYFLITWDMIKWAESDYTPADWIVKQAGGPVDENTRERKVPILVGPGRGSAAGSYVSYALGIVDVDPIENHLLFERFLEPGREGMPDIDVDFEQARRPEVFAFTQIRWGAGNVAHIGTVNYALSKAALKDAARVLKPSRPTPEIMERIDALHAAGNTAGAKKLTATGFRDANILASRYTKMAVALADKIPSVGGKAMTLSQMLTESVNAGEAFREVMQSEPVVADDIIGLARQLEGIAKAQSIHPCGFIISPEPLDELVPMRKASHAAKADPNAPRVITWNGDECEELGLLKNDILGIMNLDIAHKAMDYIAQSTGEVWTLDTIPHPNTKGNETVDGAYRLMARGQTGGVFQMDSGGMKRVAQDVVPETLDDISAIVALFRPGPLSSGMDKTYAARKSGAEPVSYEEFTRDPIETAAIDSVLGGDYGMAIYQETIMRLSTVVSGFDAAQRSRLRKAMGKKKQSEMDACLTMWTEGAPKEFLNEDGTVLSPPFAADTAQKLWDFISGAAAYLFNKCLTGESVLHGDRGARWTIEDLYHRLHGNPEVAEGICPNCNDRPSRRDTPMCARCSSWLYKFRDSRGFDLLAYDHADDRIRPQRVKDVHRNGVRPVYRIELADGKTIRATGSHRFLTPSGYVEVDELRPGGSLMVNAGYKTTSNLDSFRTTRGPRLQKEGNKPWLPGTSNSGYVDGGFVKLKEWTAQTVETAACDECGRTLEDGRLERAHLDGNRRNNEPSNLMWKCPSHHKAYDYANNNRPRRWEKGHQPEPVEIITITPDGEEMTYDVEMEEGSDHNFVVNGIVSHNSHSAAYGQLAYVTAFLKAGWPIEYGAAILAVADKDEKRLTALESLRADGIVVDAPDVNVGQFETTVVDRRVVLGMSEIKGVGGAAQYIVTEREANGPYTDMADLCTRVRQPNGAGTMSPLQSNTLVGLIEAGALDSLPGSRLGKAMAARVAKGNPDPTPYTWDPVQESTRQRLRTGVALGLHPLDALAGELADWEWPLSQEEREYGSSGGGGVGLTRLSKISDHSGAAAVTAGVISKWEERGYSGGRMANFTLESQDTAIGGVIWDRTLKSLERGGTVPQVGDVVAISGTVSVRVVTVGDADEGSEETETLKELRVNEIIPIDQPNKGATRTENVTPTGFAALYQRLMEARPTDPPPSPSPSGGGSKASIRSNTAATTTVQETEAPLATVSSLAAKRRERVAPGLLVGGLGPFGAIDEMSIAEGNDELLRRYDTQAMPAGFTGASDGTVYRARSDDGTTIVVVVGADDSMDTSWATTGLDQDSLWTGVASPKGGLLHWSVRAAIPTVQQELGQLLAHG